MTKQTEVTQPEIQLLANVVICDSDKRVLLTQYDGDDERWWLPGAELKPYEHPDDAAKRALTELSITQFESLKLHHVESFRGRRGWHVMFNYRLDQPSLVTQDAKNGQWHDATALPALAHGAWEKSVIGKLVNN